MKKERQRLYSIFEAMEDGIYISGSNYKIEYMNQTLVRYFGDGTGQPCYRVINQRDEICPWCQAQVVFRGETVRWEQYLAFNQRSYDMIELPLKNADGTVSKLSIFRDITRRKEREQKLKASEEDYYRLFENVGCGVYISTKEGKFVNANKALLNMLGYENKKEFLGIDITKDLYLKPEDRQKFQQLIERNGRVIDYEVNFKRKDGTTISTLLTSLVRYDQYGTVLGYEGIIVDQTQRKQMQKELNKTKEFIENMINSSVNGIVVADMKGEIILLNPSAKQLIGYQDKAQPNKVFVWDLYPSGEARKVMKRLRSKNYGGPGKLDRTEMKIRSLAGEEIPVEMTASIIYEDGQALATMAIFLDLRPKIEAEEKLEKARIQLIQSEKMVSIGRLAAGVAHEINNPLGGIIMYSHLVLEDLKADSNTALNLQKAITEAERCKRIVSELLDFSRQNEPIFESTDINAVIEESISMVSGQPIFQNVEILKTFDSHLPPIMGDKSQLQQVFINLAMNAAEAMKEGGRLVVETSLATGFVLITFADTGCGISPENQEKIFEPFFTTKAAQKGTGLGLAVSHGIVASHKGELSMSSRLNAGTTFIVKLPIVKT